jgi:hypothetical protein
MSKIAAILRVLTFINIEIFGMAIFMVASLVFGIFYTHNTIDYIEFTNKKIVQNSETSIKLSDNMNKLNLIDHLIIKKSTQGEKIENNINNYIAYRDSFLFNELEIQKFDSLSQKKIEIVKRIYGLNSQIVNLNKRNFELIDSSLISKKEIKRLEFSDKNMYLTIKNYKFKISDEVSGLISEYGRLNYATIHMLNFKIYSTNSSNIRFQNSLINNLKSKFINYIIVMFIIFILFLGMLYFLIRDIKTKSKIENRNKYLIAQLLNRK